VKRIILLLITLVSLQFVEAQKLMTADSAIQIALRNNYDILVAKNDAEIAKVNNTAGNAGMLPTAAINATDNYAVNDIKQKPANGTEIKRNGVSTNSLSTGVALNWTLFDGGKMFVTRKKLNEIEALGEFQFKDKVQQTVYAVVVAYYNVVKQKQQLQSSLKVSAYNQERVTILQASYNNGLVAKNTLLQAKIDLNVNRENVISQQAVILSAKRALNQLLVFQADYSDYEVSDSISSEFIPDKVLLLKKLEEQNASLLALKKQVDIASLTIKEMNSLYYPKLSLSAGYNLSQTNTEAGTILLNRSLGPQIGGSLTVPLFQAGNVKRQVATARIQMQSADWALQNQKTILNTQLTNALTDYDNQRELLGIEKDNLEIAKENLEIAMQRLRLGQSTPLEVRQAQQSFEDALTRFTNFSYNLKVSETKLKQLVAAL